MNKDLTYFKDKLAKEKELVISELKGVGVIKNKKNPDDWEATPSNMDVQRADPNEVGDFIESYEGNNAIVQELEARLSEIDDALTHIEKNTYGICSICGEKIEEDRLEANPAARTCKKHMNG
ncbi:MAG: TraR/DksA C4-type zinc finger protein [bacterium]|nr:TraR/DksA C4-type zinc finger protein [bacterium]